jgi:hypothetical protein
MGRWGNLYDLFVNLNKLNEFGALGVGWTGGKLRCRENVIIVIDDVSCLPDLAQGTPCMRSNPLHQTCALPPVS